MKNLCFIVLLMVCLTPYGINAGLPKEARNKANRLTVLIEAQTDSGISRSTGFIFRKKNQKAYAITKNSLLPKNSKISVTLFGENKTKTTLRGTLFACSTRNDLAVIEFEARKLDLDLFGQTQEPLKQTMPVFFPSFYFSDNEKSLTAIKKGSITKLQRDQAGCIIFVVIDADINHYDLGSPVLDEKGCLIGILIQRIMKGSKIGRVMYAPVLDTLCEGNIEKTNLGEILKENDKYKLSFTINIFNPLLKVKKMFIGFVSQDDFQKSHDKDAFLKKSLKEVKITGQTAQGFYILPEAQKNKGTYVSLVKQVNGKGQTDLSGPFIVSLDLNKAVSSKNKNSGKKNKNGKESAEVSSAEKNSLPKGKEVDRSLVEKSYKDGAIDITKTKNLKQQTQNIIWSRDFKSVFVAGEKGEISKISFPEMKETLCLDVKNKVSDMKLCRSGLILALPDKKEIWIINENDLSVKNIIKVDHVLKLLASPSSDIVFSVNPNDRLKMPMIDIKNAKVLGVHDSNKLSHYLKDILDFSSSQISPDGKFVVTRSSEFLYCFKIIKHRVLGYDLHLRKKIQPPKGYSKLKFSPDSHYLAFPQQKKIYSLKNLDSPIISLESKDLWNGISFDEQRGLIYFWNTSGFKAFDSATGKNIKLNSMAKNCKGGLDIYVEEMLVNPLNGLLLVNSVYSLSTVSLSDEIRKRTKIPQKSIGSKLPTSLKKGISQKRIAKFETKTFKEHGSDIAKFQIENKIIPYIPISKDKKYFYVSSENGVIRKISFDDYEQKRILNLSAPIESLSMSKSYLVAYQKEQNNCKLILINPDSLKVEAGIPGDFYLKVATSPALDLAFAATNDADMFLFDLKKKKMSTRISSFDLEKKFKNKIKRHNVPHGNDFFRWGGNYKLSPDGKNLFCADSYLRKFKIVDKFLKYEEMGPRTKFNLYFSVNGKFIILPCEGINKEESELGAKPNSAFIYKADDLSNAIGFINEGALFPSEVIYDSSKDMIFTIGTDLSTYNKEGFLINKYRRISPEAAISVPNKNQLLAVDDKVLTLVTF